MKIELKSNQSPVASSEPETPTTPLYNSSMKMDMSDTSLGRVDMLNAVGGHRENVLSADGKVIRKTFFLSMTIVSKTKTHHF